MNKVKFQNNKGFTLTELLVSIAILSIVTGAVYLGFTLSQKAYHESEKAAEITQNGRVILERITRELHQSREIATELLEEESEGQVIPEGGIIFEDGHVEDPYNYIHYFKEEEKIKREVIAYYFSGNPGVYVPWDSKPSLGQTLETETLESAKTIGEYLTTLKFWGSKVINISLTLEKNNKKIDLKTKVFGRNL
ncbi:MAG: prepilin-type N-terminal cleavage/methylation domain-containing protein [bacterium]